MQDIQLFKEFIQFCDKQPKDREINHGGSYCQCAVGDFYEEIRGDREEADESADLVLGYGELANAVGNSKCPSNYGDFTTFLKLELDKLELIGDNESV